VTEQDKEGKCKAQAPPLRAVSDDGNIPLYPRMIQKADGSWTLDNPEAFKELLRAMFAGLQKRRDWFIFLRFLEGFKVRFGCWPTHLHLPRDMFDYLRNYLFTREEYSKIKKKIKLIPDDKLIIAKDKEGRIHDFMEDGYPSSIDMNSTGWLGIDPLFRRSWEDEGMSINLPSIDGKDDWVYVRKYYESECYYNNTDIEINRKSKQIKVKINSKYNDIGRQNTLNFRKANCLDITGYQKLSHTICIIIYEYNNLKAKLLSYVDYSLSNDILYRCDEFKNTLIDILPYSKFNDILIKIHYDYDLTNNLLQKAYNRLSQRIINQTKKLIPKRKPRGMRCLTPLLREPSGSQSIILPISRKQ
jgi:hypothetical protein